DSQAIDKALAAVIGNASDRTSSEEPGDVDTRQQIQPNSAQPSDERVFASPLARKHAKELDIDISTIAGSGPRGRIIRSDVDAALREATATAPTPINTGSLN